MDFSIATLLSHFSGDKLVAAKFLEKKLGCEDEETQAKLEIALDALEKIGVLVKERGKYRRIHEGDVVEAKLRCSSKGFCFAIQDIEESDDIYVRESHLSNAWNGDRVLVKIIKEGTRRRSPEGEVKVILERANPSLLATVKKEDNNYRAVPLDDRLLFEMMLKQNGGNLEEAIDHLVHVSVLRYPIAQNPPIGKVTKILGSDAEAATDTDIVSCKHDLPQGFSEKVLKEANSLETNISEAEIERRWDLRHLVTIAIEPEKSAPTVIENAFTLEATEEGCQFGIHIIDVAHYIQPESHLEREARKRGTSVYLGDLVLPLLPENLLDRIGFKEREDRLALSILINFNNQGQMLEYQINPSVINLNCKLTYPEVQIFLGSETQPNHEMTIIAAKLNKLFFEISPLLKAQRIKRGGFDINLTEAQVNFKDEGRLGAICISSFLPIRSLLTELVVFAGKLIADHLQALDIPGIYCTQTEPDFEELEDVIKLANNLALDFQLQSEEEISPIDYQNLTRCFTKSQFAKVLNYLLYSTLKPIKYSTHPANHFGLAYNDGYVHFISPAQRYADLLIQRILNAVFIHGRDRRHKNTKTGVNLGSNTCHGEIKWNVLPSEIQEDLEQEITIALLQLNDREKVGHDAEKDLQGLKKAEKMKARTGHILNGLITGVQSYGFFVEIEDWLVEGLVHVSSLKDDWYEYRARHSCLVGRKNRIAYRLGDTVEVEIKSVDYYRQQIDLGTVRGGSDLRDEDLED
jgi:ribonuclease R